MLTASYVGNEGHRLVTSIEANPANQAECLFLNNPANLAPNSAGPVRSVQRDSAVPGDCRPTGRVSEPALPGSPPLGRSIPAVRPLGPLFDTNPFVSTIANSHYNSFQASLSHSSGSLSFLAGYTYSKCMDNASGLQDSTNPFNPALSISLCNFDVMHNFVFSYNWLMPFDKYVTAGWAKKVVGGWSLSGVTNFATGLPITMSENDDNSLIGANAIPVDVPNFAGGHVLADYQSAKGWHLFQYVSL